ncbi:MAG: dipeptidase [Alistipes sp.]|nr:dipeptidase [Alistipes sp.]
MPVMTPKEFIDINRERFIDELFTILRIPSVSAQSQHKPDMQRCAESLAASLVAAGADHAEVYPTNGNPVVFGEKITDRNAPTILVYGHYDVMPTDPRGEWNTDPFEPVIKDGRIWARGADDDKGQLFMHVKAFEAMCATNSLNCNVKFMLEGEEEIGSTHLYGFCEEYKEMLAADIILVSDTSMIGADVPSITCGLRGLTYMEVEVTGPNRDLHSGHYGGGVANPANVLSRLVASLIDENGHITIPHFYDDVRVFSDEERRDFNSAPFSIEEYKHSLDIGDVEGEAGFTTMERTGIRPSLDVNGIWSGYIGEGAKTVIPSRASAKISMRLVPNQDFSTIARLFEEHFRAIAPASVKVDVKFLHGGAPYVSPTDMPAYKAAEKAIEDVLGKRPLPYYSGGSIPIISGFEKILGIKSVLMGFGLEEDAIHSPNESFGVERFFKGIEAITLFYKYYTESRQ